MEGKIALQALYGAYMLFVDEDDDEEKTVLEKVNQFAEEVVPRWSDHQFKTHFRMFPDTFEKLLRNLYAVKYAEKSPHPKEVLFGKQIMMMIWYIGNRECFRSVADRFGISKSTSWEILYRNCLAMMLLNDRHKIISWPSEQRQTQIANNFFQINQFPGVIGAIDGCHIEILKPGENGNSFINRKSFPSVILQGVCDNRMLFTDVYAGECGSMHDNRVFLKSNIYERIRTGIIRIPHNHHIIGDLAYQLRPYLLVGFKAYANRTERQVIFNTKLSQIRVIIENAFAHLVGRFRRLQSMNNIRLDGICVIIMTVCILHNLCILDGDELIDADVQAELDRVNVNVEVDGADEEIYDPDGAVDEVLKRNDIVEAIT